MLLKRRILLAVLPLATLAFAIACSATNGDAIPSQVYDASALFEVKIPGGATLLAAGRYGFPGLIIHAIEGYYSDPGNGGNHDSISWQMIGYRVTG